MSTTRKILRVFLASPGDLQQERQAVRSAVTECNECLSDTFGFHIELVGWEDTVSRFGRPQHLINAEVDRCDLFLGMMWKRWGTPPDVHGTYSSGFEEEFELALARRQRTDNPEISIFFKHVPDDALTDPGEDLKKVLRFRKTIESNKQILFQVFHSAQEMERWARRCLIDYLTRISHVDETPTPAAENRVDPSSESESRDPKTPTMSPVSVEGFSFLESLVGKIQHEGGMDDLSAFDVARFRLLSNSISKPGNQEISMGPHDLNLIFRGYHRGTKIGTIEVLCLARLGLKYMLKENVPFWCWYTDLLKRDSSFDVALLSSMGNTNDDETISAIKVLTALGRPLPTNTDVTNRDSIVKRWLSDRTASRVKSAALAYLARHGTDIDYAYAEEEYSKNSDTTSRHALECMVAIRLRHPRVGSPQVLILESQFESFEPSMLESVLDGLAALSSEQLWPGLQHRSTRVLLRTLRILLERGELDDETLERLLGHTDALVRYEVISELRKRGKLFSTDEVKKILVKEGRSDGSGQVYFDRYLSADLKKESESDLTTKVNSSSVYQDLPYFARRSCQ